MYNSYLWWSEAFWLTDKTFPCIHKPESCSCRVLNVFKVTNSWFAHGEHSFTGDQCMVCSIRNREGLLPSHSLSLSVLVWVPWGWQEQWQEKAKYLGREKGNWAFDLLGGLPRPQAYTHVHTHTISEGYFLSNENANACREWVGKLYAGFKSRGERFTGTRAQPAAGILRTSAARLVECFGLSWFCIYLVVFAMIT